jgi:HPt (histidine-containing phosphotransfer) domain-containing protein
VAPDVDLERLTLIREAMGIELSELVGGMLGTMEEAIEQADRAMRLGELDQAAKAAHACRNDALMLGARELLHELAALEQTARAGERVGAEAALAGIHEVWPRTRAELIRATSDR